MSIGDATAPAHIVALSSRQAASAGAVLSRSHAEYPSFRHLFPERARRARALQAMFTGESVATRRGSAYAAVTDDGAVFGVAIWLAPGRYPWSVWRQLRGAGWMFRVLRAARVRFEHHEDRCQRRPASPDIPALVSRDDGG
jgi:hypothetical protein